MSDIEFPQRNSTHFDKIFRSNVEIDSFSSINLFAHIHLYFDTERSKLEIFVDDYLAPSILDTLCEPFHLYYSIWNRARAADVKKKGG